MNYDQKQFSLTVWRPSSLARDLAQYSDGPGGSTFTRVHPTEHFYEVAYAWATKEDIWGGLVDPATTQKLRDLLITTFSPVNPPVKRDMNALARALAEIKPLLGDDTLIAWQDLSGQTGELESDAITRANMIVALFHHLSWVHAIYQDLPGASITIR